MKYAVVGTNFISDSFAQAISNTKSEIVAVYSRKEETGKVFQNAWQIKTLHTDFAEMLENKEVEGVYIATPNSLHFSQGKQVLESGKHLLLEKPATITTQEFEILEGIAKKNNLAFLEAMRPHFLPTYEKMRNEMANIGKIRRCMLSFCQYSSRYDNFKKGIIENAFVKEFGNGAMIDLGVYAIAVMLMLFGTPKSYTATAEIIPDHIDIQGTLLCQYDGFEVVLSYGKVAYCYQLNEISGEKASILFQSTSKPKSFVVKRGESEEEFICETEDNNMIFEINMMDEVAKNPEKAQQYRDLTKTAIEIMQNARTQIGYSFE